MSANHLSYLIHEISISWCPICTTYLTSQSRTSSLLVPLFFLLYEFIESAQLKSQVAHSLILYTRSTHLMENNNTTGYLKHHWTFFVFVLLHLSSSMLIPNMHTFLNNCFLFVCFILVFFLQILTTLQLSALNSYMERINI